MPEFLRKRIVHLKRKPEILPTIAIIISCMVYTFKLSNFSMAAIYCNTNYVAILLFAITLLSLLSIFTYMGSHDKKGTKVPMLILSILMIALIIVFDVISYSCYHRDAIAESERVNLAVAAKDSVTHIIWLSITLVLIIFKPLYAKALAKINTSVTDDEFANDKDDSQDEVIAGDEQ